MKTLKGQLTGKCKYFSGNLFRAFSDKTIKCEAGVSYYELVKIDELGYEGCGCRTPCSGRKAGSVENGETVQYCEKYEALSEKDIQARIDEIKRFEDLMMKGLSSCCEAPINETQVIQSGQYEGHGPRFCGKCKKLVYMV